MRFSHKGKRIACRTPKNAEDGRRPRTTIEARGRPCRTRTSSAGEWKPAADGATDKIVDPATGEVIGEVPSSGPADVDAAVQAAARLRLRRRGPRKTPRARSEALAALADADRGPTCPSCRASSRRNVGKPVSIMEFELDLTLDNWRFFAAAGRFLEGKAAGEYVEGYTSMVRREPLGVVGSIAPWNYPLQHGDLEGRPRPGRRQHGRAQAVRAHAVHGAAARPSSPAEILPPGVLNVVCGQGETAGAALVEHPDVAMVSLTGSVAAGKAVARGGVTRR